MLSNLDIEKKPQTIYDPLRQKTLELKLPTNWCGHDNCVVGPFSDQQAAKQFIKARLQFGEIELFYHETFIRGNATYVRVTGKGHWFY
ncbi:MAG: hypothetical protein KDD45_14125 [Bdellovibrionales bacterium]|nr:hypothetical protein [Bdellovibrionales bacterium]